MSKRQIKINLMPVSFPNLLTLLFIYLKLTDKIDWTWFWVLSPTIFTFGLALTFFVGFITLAFIAHMATPTRRF